MPGLFERAAQAVRYTISGVTPETWMSPQQPLPPVAPADVKGRLWDYPVALNLNYVPRANEPPGFDKLRQLGNSDLFRIVVERKKDVIEAFEWSIKPREVEQGKRPPESQFKAQIAQIKGQLEYPDRVLDWAQWLRGALDQVYIFDALSIYRRPDMGGKLYGLELLDGSTIKPLIDQYGRRPAAPDPAFQQRLKGVPAVDFSTDELLYYPKNLRPGYVYGFPPSQMVINIVETTIERLKSQKAYFTEGNMPDGFMSGPPEWTTDQITRMQGFWDSIFSGNVAQRRHAWWVPHGSEWKEMKQPPLKDEFDEWLIRVICFTLSTSPTPFVKQTNRATAENQQEVAEEGGAATDMAYVKRVMDRIIREDFQAPELEFAWSTDREFDPQVASEIIDQKQKTARLTLNEARDLDGLDAVEGGDEPMFYTASGWVTLSQMLDASAKAIAMPAMQPPQPGAAPGDDSADHEHEDHGAPPPPKPKDEADLKKGLAPLPTRPFVRERRRAMAKTTAAVLRRQGEGVEQQVTEQLRSLGKAADDTGKFHAQALTIAASVSLDDLDALADELVADLTAIAFDSASIGLAQVGVQSEGDLTNRVNQRAVAWARARAAQLVSAQGDANIVQSTRNVIRDLIVQGLEANIGTPAIADSIAKSMAFAPERADLIAQTEANRANSQGALQGYKEAAETGVQVRKEWLLGENACDICQENAEAGAIDLDDDFPSGDDAPPAHPNCECALSPVTGDA